MASISVSGIGSAGRTGGWAASIAKLGLAVAGLATLGASPLAGLDVAAAGFRSTKGLVRVCVTADAHHFPGCQDDPAARRLTVTVAQAAAMRFGELPSGDYAVALFHDENGNGRVDTALGIPTEGVGFSNNPRLTFGPPSFARAAVVLTDQTSEETVRLRYFL